MDAIAVLVDIARRPQHAAEMLRDRLTPALLNAHPHHDNSIAWLLWHSAREIDVQLAQLTGEPQVWVAGGFSARFGLPVSDDDLGYGHTSEQARSVVVTDPDLLLTHLTAVIDAQVGYISRLTPADLERVVDDSWDPPVTLGVRLVSMSADALEHLAQAMYIAGMRGGAFEAE